MDPDQFYAKVFFTFRCGILLLTQLGILENTPFRWYADDLDDLSPASEQRDAKLLDENLKMLRSYDRSHMTRSAALSADVLDWFLDDQQRGNSKFMFYDYPVNQMFGAQNGCRRSITTQPLKRRRDAPPTSPAPRRSAARSIRRSTDSPCANSAGHSAAFRAEARDHRDERLHRAAGRQQRDRHALPRAHGQHPGLEAQPAQLLLGEVTAAVANDVYPAYRRMIAKCEALEAKAGDDDGVWKFPNGDAYYDYALRHYTTSDLPADSIHALGLREVDRIQALMRPLMKANGLKTQPFAAGMAQLRQDPRFSYPAGDEGRAQILARYQAILDDASARCDSLFDVRPKARLEVKRVPEFKRPDRPVRTTTARVSTALAPACSTRTCATRRRRTSPTCARSRTTRASPGITSRSRSRTSSRACRSSGG